MGDLLLQGRSATDCAKALQVDGMDGEFRAPERNPGSGAYVCSLGCSCPDPDCQGCCAQYRARYGRRSHRCRLFAVCVVIFAHRMKPPTPNPAAALEGGRPVLLTILARWPAASEPHCYAGA